MTNIQNDSRIDSGVNVIENSKMPNKRKREFGQQEEGAIIGADGDGFIEEESEEQPKKKQKIQLNEASSAVSSAATSPEGLNYSSSSEEEVVEQQSENHLSEDGDIINKEETTEESISAEDLSEEDKSDEVRTSDADLADQIRDEVASTDTIVDEATNSELDENQQLDGSGDVNSGGGDSEKEKIELYDDSYDLNFFEVELTADNIMDEMEKASKTKPEANRLDLDITKQNEQMLEQVIRFLKVHPEITNLSIRNAGLEPDNIKTIADFLKDSSIKKLSIGNNNIDLASLKDLLSALCEKSCQISSLELSNIKLSSAQMSLIMKYLPQTKITHLDLGANSLYSDDVHYLKESIKNLKSLDLGNNYIDDEGAILLKELLEDSQMEYLALHGNELSRKGCKLLGDHNMSYAVNIEDNPSE